jgi:hypothetical protein
MVVITATPNDGAQSAEAVDKNPEGTWWDVKNQFH